MILHTLRRLKRALICKIKHMYCFPYTSPECRMVHRENSRYFGKVRRRNETEWGKKSRGYR